MLHPVEYIEKGIGLHNSIQNAGFHLVQIDGAWFADSADVQELIDGYTAEPLANELIVKIKLLAGEKIQEKYPQWKQLNMLARHAELMSLPEIGSSERTEIAALQAAWAWIKQVREASAVHEAALLALAAAGDFASLLGYDVSAHWL